MPQTPVIIQSPKQPLNPIVILVGAGIAYFGYTELKKLYDEYKAKSDLVKDQATTIKVGTDPKNPKKKLLDLNGKPIQSVNLALIATDINAALHPGWYKPTEQDRAVRAFKNTPFGYVKDLEKIYLDKYNENLKDTMADKLNDVNFIKVKHFFSY